MLLGSPAPAAKFQLPAGWLRQNPRGRRPAWRQVPPPWDRTAAAGPVERFGAPVDFPRLPAAPAGSAAPQIGRAPAAPAGNSIRRLRLKRSTATAAGWIRYRPAREPD